MKFKKGNEVTINDGSFSFGIYNNEYHESLARSMRDAVLTVVATELDVLRGHSHDDPCDLLVTDNEGNFSFVQSCLCNPIDKEIELRYFCDGIDITDKISDKTRKNLAK